ncbi:MAG: Borrelia membrane protein P13 [Phormidesmis priestleyi Ana]|uniref:Borrelia membrane protein P13 n=1 Tax=Phormidesmis priestleyi Ana TaxID=1666911 RepID=A0A0P7Z1P5_9CYAN|nr:MAG: Borrelia membrane protein P13 [Phormidesmis priestleyi Ana]
MSLVPHPVWIAQTPVVEQPQPQPPAVANLWMYAFGAQLVLLIGLGTFSALQTRKLQKQLKFETYKNRELQKRIKLALSTITQMERNPDLIYSRDFNLDYLRMRMEESQFNFAIVNQLKIKVKQRLSEALRPSQASSGTVGIASQPRTVSQIFDVDYISPNDAKKRKRVLFRIQIELTKLPSQATSTTVAEIVKCIETFLNPPDGDGFWQPTLQGRLANMNWDQKAKPTPLLLLQQTNEGVNVTFRTKTNNHLVR